MKCQEEEKKKKSMQAVNYKMENSKLMGQGLKQGFSFAGKQHSKSLSHHRQLPTEQKLEISWSQ